MVDTLIEEVLKAGRDAYASAGWLATAGVSLSYALRVFRQFGGERHWSKLTTLGQLAVVGLLALLSALLVAVAGGATWQAALFASIPVAVTAIATHKGTQAAGKMMPVTGNRLVDTSIRVAFNRDRLKVAK